MLYARTVKELRNYLTTVVFSKSQFVETENFPNLFRTWFAHLYRCSVSWNQNGVVGHFQGQKIHDLQYCTCIFTFRILRRQYFMCFSNFPRVNVPVRKRNRLTSILTPSPFEVPIGSSCNSAAFGKKPTMGNEFKFHCNREYAQLTLWPDQ